MDRRPRSLRIERKMHAVYRRAASAQSGRDDRRRRGALSRWSSRRDRTRESRRALSRRRQPLRRSRARFRRHRVRRGGLLHRDDRLRRGADRSVVRRADLDVHLSDDRQLRHLRKRRRNIGASASRRPSSSRSPIIRRTISHATLPVWLDDRRCSALVGADTRAITIALREHGTIWAALAVGDAALAQAAERRLRSTCARRTRAAGSQRRHRAKLLRSVRQRQRTSSLIDCGVKRAILRQLEALGARITVLPYDATVDEVLAQDPAAVVISPGPGDPTDLAGNVETAARARRAQTALRHLFGAPAAGAGVRCATYKLPYGHRGGNQPVHDLRGDEVLVTAHNHGYAVDAQSLPGDLEATMTNLNDGTNEGFRHRTLPIVGGAVSSRSGARPVRCAPPLCAMVRRAAAALALLTVAWLATPAPWRAQSLQRLTVESFVLWPIRRPRRSTCRST